MVAETVLAEEFAEEVDRYSLPEDLALINDNNDIPMFSLENEEAETWAKFKEQYYRRKFKVEEQDIIWTSKTVAKEYVKALQWTLKYYLSDCSSWSWFYPYHFGPFPSDLKLFLQTATQEELNQMGTWTDSVPCSPVEQLVNVMPMKSIKALPKACQDEIGKLKPPIDEIFVDPVEIDRDPNGRTYKYQWVSLLPILQENQITALSDTVNETKPLWSHREKTRDSFGETELYCNIDVPFASELRKSEGNGGKISKLRDKTGLFGYVPRVESMGKKDNVLVAPYQFQPRHGLSTMRCLARARVQNQTSTTRLCTRLLSLAR